MTPTANYNSGRREVSKSAVAKALAQPCGAYQGIGAVKYNDGYIDGSVTCDACGGSGLAGVPGCRLQERGESVIIK